MLQQDVEIVNKLGLHARASAKLSQTANQFKSDVHLGRNGNKVNAKSIIGVMMLAAAKGSTIAIETNGPDEAAALEAVLHLILNKFGEGE